MNWLKYCITLEIMMSNFVVINELVNGYGMFTILIKSQNLMSKSVLQILELLWLANEETVRFFQIPNTISNAFPVQPSLCKIILFSD